MKNLFRILLAVALVVVFGQSVSAQKFGMINSQELIAVMPELDSVQIKLKAFNAELLEQMETIQVEFNTKLEEYQNKLSTYSESVRQLKEKELQDIQTRYSNFQQIAQQDANKMQQQLMAPVVERAENAIKKVAKEGGYWMIFDDSVGATIYNDSTHVTDVMPHVKKALGIPENAKPAGQAAATPAAAPAPAK